MRTQPLWYLAAGLLAVLLAAPAPSRPAPASAGDWPQWRGPSRTGVSSETGLLKRWPTTGPPLVWTGRGAGDGYSAVAVSAGRLFTMGNRGDDEFVIAYDTKSGRELWATRNGAAYDNDRGDGPRGTPTVEGDVLYALGANGDLSCLEVENGTVRWHVNILKQFGGQNAHWGLSESPLVEGDTVVVTPGGPGASIVALDKETGHRVWQSKQLNDPAGYSSAIAATVGKVRQIIQFTSRGVVGVRASDGQFLWRYDKVANRTADVATPIVHGDLVFATSAYDTGCGLIKLTSAGTTTKAKEVYFNRAMMNHHGGVVLVDDHVYGFTNAKGGQLVCMEFATGRVKWSDRSVGKGSVVCADGHLYCLGENGTVGLVEATPEAYREQGRFKINKGRLPAWAHPVVAGGRLYIRDQDTVRCYDVGED